MSRRQQADAAGETSSSVIQEDRRRRAVAAADVADIQVDVAVAIDIGRGRRMAEGGLGREFELASMSLPPAVESTSVFGKPGNGSAS